MSYDIELHIAELRAELNECWDADERQQIAEELTLERAIKAAIDEDTYLADIESRIGTDLDLAIPF